MCGITGYYSHKKSCDLLKYYNAHLKIRHRGPDDEGLVSYNGENYQFYRGKDTVEDLKYLKDIRRDGGKSNMILGHRRLSILDLSSRGHQPMCYKGLVLTFNGEIFNYREIRENLKNLGYHFQTETDTEVVLLAYHAYGAKCFEMFNGMWALSIFDKRDESIVLSRDRYGVKPLYYSNVSDRLVFASEVKFVLEFISEVKANPDMVIDFVEHGKIWHTNETMFEGIFQIEPGSYLINQKGNEKIQTYYNPTFGIRSEQISIRPLIEDSISIRLQSDVNLGCMLSGGIDSSIIAYTIAGMRDDLRTFTVTNKEFDPEADFVKLATESGIFENDQINVDPRSNDVDSLLEVIEFPFRSFTVSAQNELFKFVKEKSDVKVLLSGEGADEVFTGYNIHPYIFLYDLLRTFKFNLLSTEIRAISHKEKIRKIEILKRLFIVALSINDNPIVLRIKWLYNNYTSSFNISRKYTKKRKHSKEKLYNYLVESHRSSALREYLMYSDLNSMKNSIEVRVPFLDYRVVEAGFAMSSDKKIKNGLAKQILRHEFKGKVPEEILQRVDKKGFYLPFERWVSEELIPDMDAVFLNMSLKERFVFVDYDKFMKRYYEFRNGRSKKDYTYFWRMYLLHRWKIVWSVVS